MTSEPTDVGSRGTSEPLTYFTCEVDGVRYGGWYRKLTPSEIEVLAVGLLTVAAYCGDDAESTARATLTDFVRRSTREGRPIPSVTDGAAPLVSRGSAPVA